MIANNDPNKQLPTEIKSVFKELGVLKHLRNAGITKSFGISSAIIFQLIFRLIFEHKNWFRMLDSKKSADLPAKDTVYRFLNKSTFNWRRFLLALASSVISKVSAFTSHRRPKVFIIDDSSYDRNRSKKSRVISPVF